MSNNTGGPAFPRSESLYPDGTVSDHGAQGLSIRDYFAAKAMQGMLSNCDRPTDMEAQDFADAAYEVADAMLKAREASNGS